MANDNTANSASTLLDATKIVDKLQFRTGKSAKTGNDYIMGSLYIKTRSGKPYRLDLKYIDENDEFQIADALNFADEKDAVKTEFQEGLTS